MRPLIVAAAREWFGTPWRHQGRLKGEAVDCGGLIIGVGKELGLLDFDTRDYGRLPDGLQLRALCEQHLVPRPVAEALPGDVLLMRFTRHPSLPDVLPFTNEAASLKPYAPVHVRGSRNGAGDLTITWIRRTRFSGEWRDLVDVR